jgi:hypothetical protein
MTPRLSCKRGTRLFVPGDCTSAGRLSWATVSAWDKARWSIFSEYRQLEIFEAERGDVFLGTILLLSDRFVMIFT